MKKVIAFRCDYFAKDSFLDAQQGSGSALEY